MGRSTKKVEGADGPRQAQSKQVFLLDELGRFVAGATREGLPLKEGMVGAKALEVARELVASREVAWGTYLSKTNGDQTATVCGGRDFFACAGEDPVQSREVPHELAAVVSAFEGAARAEIRAGGLSKESIAAFPSVVAAALADPAKYAAAPKGPLAFARGTFKPSGARLALDLEIVNATPWPTHRVELRLAFDGQALPLVSVKARTGSYEAGLLELPQVAARSRERALLLFEPKAAGTHEVVADLRLEFDSGREERGRMRPARVTIGQAHVGPTVPRTLVEFRGLIDGRLTYAAPVEMGRVLGGLATVAGLATEVEKDQLAKVLDWRGNSGEREVWYLGLFGDEGRPLLVQLTQGKGGTADVVVAGARPSDVMAYAARLRGRLDVGYGPSTLGEPRIDADLRPEREAAEPRASIVARQISADIASGELDTRMRKPRSSAARSLTAGSSMQGGQSAGDELVPGLIDALERSLRRK